MKGGGGEVGRSVMNHAYGPLGSGVSVSVCAGEKEGFGMGSTSCCRTELLLSSSSNES